MKSWLDFGERPARTAPLAPSGILARLLAAALIDQRVHTEPAFSPWGYGL